LEAVDSAPAVRLQQERQQAAWRASRSNSQSPGGSRSRYDRAMGTIKDRLLGAVDRLAGDGESCSFCAKPGDAVAHLIAGPHVMICDECIDICIAVLADQDAEWREQKIAALVNLRKH
jgi:hypothetical protein